MRARNKRGTPPLLATCPCPRHGARLRVSDTDLQKPQQRFDDLRGVLRYVPQFRQRVFVISIDGALMQRSEFPSLLQDIAVLQSLNIEVVLVFGARAQIQALATERGVTLTSDDGMGRTDASTLQIAKDAIMRQASDLIAHLTALETPAAITNALAVHPAGVIAGEDQEFTGRIERVDDETLRVLLRADIIPILPPMGYDGKGTTLRLNSDAVAVEIAIALRAAKVIFLAESGIEKDGQRVAQLSAAAARDIYRKKDHTSDVNLLSKLRYGALACEEGVPRVHIVNGTSDEALLMELFSNEGVGTMIHGDEYQQIRAASASDVNALLSMMQLPMEDAALASRSRENIIAHLDDYFVLEVDGNPIGSVAIHGFEHDGVPSAELACLFVQRSHKNKGHGKRLVGFAEDTARSRGCQRIVALSTQAFRFFEEKMGYIVTDPAVLSHERRAEYSANGRNSKVLVKTLSA